MIKLNYKQLVFSGLILFFYPLAAEPFFSEYEGFIESIREAKAVVYELEDGEEFRTEWHRLSAELANSLPRLQTLLDLQKKIGNVRELRTIANGNHLVFKALLNDRKILIVKCFKPHQLHEFVDEIWAYAFFDGRIPAPQIYQIGRIGTPEVCYIVEEYIEGVGLYDRYKRFTKMGGYPRKWELDQLLLITKKWGEAMGRLQNLSVKSSIHDYPRVKGSILKIAKEACARLGSLGVEALEIFEEVIEEGGILLGVGHGDAHPVNMLIVDKEIVFIDLEKAGALISPEGRGTGLLHFDFAYAACVFQQLLVDGLTQEERELLTEAVREGFYHVRGEVPNEQTLLFHILVRLFKDARHHPGGDPNAEHHNTSFNQLKSQIAEVVSCLKAIL